MIGKILAHYKILEKIGSGGMGDVYLAEDTKLDRNVALKVLPPELAENEERRARFKREAKAIAALNHPNIVHVYSVEEADGVHFITMELVKGKTLAELLPKKGFALDKFFDIAIPLADAVASAHEQGIVHPGQGGRSPLRHLFPRRRALRDDHGKVQLVTDAFSVLRGPSWSSDGHSLYCIAFYSNRAGDRDIWVMPASGGPARGLTEGLGEDYGPTWSPDGEMIAFEHIEIYVIPTRGGEPRSIASDPDYLLEWPSWSPDGQWIAYQQRRGALWRVPSAGGAPEGLTEGKGNRPQWSRDGKQLFYLVGAHFADQDAGRERLVSHA